MKKIFIIILATACQLQAFCQVIKQPVIKVETSAAHGYEVKFISSVASDNHLFETAQPWLSVSKIIGNNSGWSLPSINQLKTIRADLQQKMAEKNITMGSDNWIGLYGWYWCTKNEKGDISDLNNIFAAGGMGNRFGINQTNGPEPIARKENTFKTILIRSY